MFIYFLFFRTLELIFIEGDSTPQSSLRHQDIPKSSPKESYLSKDQPIHKQPAKENQNQNKTHQHKREIRAVFKGGKVRFFKCCDGLSPMMSMGVNYLVMKVDSPRSSSSDGFWKRSDKKNQNLRQKKD